MNGFPLMLSFSLTFVLCLIALPSLRSWRAFGAVLTITAACGLGGLGTGYAIGTLLPSYYRAADQSAIGELHIPPQHYGALAGVMQGLLLGNAASVIALAVLAWRARQRSDLALATPLRGDMAGHLPEFLRASDRSG